jgi:hypothetical protein
LVAVVNKATYHAVGRVAVLAVKRKVNAKFSVKSEADDMGVSLINVFVQTKIIACYCVLVFTYKPKKTLINLKNACQITKWQWPLFSKC